MKKLLILVALLICMFYTSFAKDRFDLQLYELMYKSFIYTNDIKNAYKITKKVVEKIPFNLKWKKRLAQLSLWLSNVDEAFENYMYVYKKTKDKSIEKILFKFPYPEVVDLKINLYEEEVRKGNFTNVLELAKLYEYKGEPEKSLTLLNIVYEKTKNKKFLFEYIRYAAKLGEIEIISKYIPFLKNLPLKEKINISKLLIERNRYKEVLETLRYVEDLPNNKEYYKLLIYALFKLGDYDKLTRLLNYIYSKDKIDEENLYLLMSYYYSQKDYKSLEKLLKDAIYKYKLSNLYQEYINVLIINGRYKKILRILKNKRNYFKNKKRYYFLLAYVYAKLGYKEKALKIYQKILSNYKLNLTEKKEILWFFIDNIENFKSILERYLPYFAKDKNLYMIVINGYLKLNYIDKAYLIASKFLKYNRKNIQFLVLYADILSMQSNFDESNFYYMKAWRLAQRKLKENPSIIYNEEFLRNYLRLSIFYSKPNRVKKLLNIAKNVLTYNEYLNLMVDYYLSYGEYEPVFYIYNYKRVFQ